MSTYQVQVSGLAPTTTEAHLNDFFTFCGKITSIDFNEKSEPKSATIHFEKSSAAKTALMLNGGTLDGAHLIVSSETAHHDDPSSGPTPKDGPVDQADKPRAGIAAEYIAKGYSLSDQILQRAIELDHQHGISQKFLTYFSSIDSTVGQKALGPDKTISGKMQEGVNAGLERAKTLDHQKGISKKAGDYYTQALGTPFGQKVRAFYTTTSKQIQDIHEEARRIADESKAAAHTPAGTTTAEPSAAAPSDEKSAGTSEAS